MKQGRRKLLIETNLVLPKGRGGKRWTEMMAFTKGLVEISHQVGFRVSARGWGYLLEGMGLITKAQIDLVEKEINECRKLGFLAVDFTAEEEARQFSGVKIPETISPVQYMKRFLEATLTCENWYNPDWWDGETYYVQMVVEKIDLKTLFEPVCQKYNIPIATSKGWSSLLQRAEYARRYKKAEENGLTCVLLYCGDFDPDGLRISEFLRRNLEDLSVVRWNDGTKGYDPKNLIIVRFGLNYNYILVNNLVWIMNLITGSGKNLADPSHPNYHLPYVQEYLKKIGPRKCEANAILRRPDVARDMCRDVIEHGAEEWHGLGSDALARFKKKRDAVVEELQKFRSETGLAEAVEKALKIIRETQEGKDEEE